MTTGVVTTSFPRHRGDFAGCFVEDDVRERARAGETIDVIAAGGWHPANEAPLQDPGNGIGARAANDLPDSVTVLRVPVPTPHGAEPLFFGDGAPETLERGGAAVWIQALGFWAGLCQRIRERAGTWDRVTAHWLVPCALAAHTVAGHLPLTAYAHSGDVALLERLPGGAALGRLLARHAAQLNFVSSDLHQRFARLTGVTAGRVTTLAASYAVAAVRDPATRAQARARQGLDPTVDRPAILAVGRLVPIKGFDVLLLALARATAADKGQPPPYADHPW